MKFIGSLVLTLVVLMGVFAAERASAAVSVSRAEVSGTRLRLEGAALPNRDITVDGVVFGRSDGAGAFRIARDPFTPPADCTVDVNDGSPAVTVAVLNGCTVTGPVPPPSGDTTAPSVPANLTAVLSGTTANLSWTASTDNIGVTGYQITRNGLPHTTVLNTFYNGTGLAAGTYTYTVAAVDGAGNVSAASNSASVTVAPPPATDTTAPTVPANLVITLLGTTIGLSWDISSDNTAVTGYRVSRGGAVRGTTIDTTFQDSGVAGATYTYSVVAFDAAGNTSGASNSVTVTLAAAEVLGFITPARLPDATVGQAYLGYIVATDPPGPSTFRFRLVAGRVPAGTSFTGNTLPNRPEARVTGTPTTVGTSTFTVEVTDGTGARVSRTFTIVVAARPALTIPSGVNVLDAAIVGQSYSGVLPVSGGGPLRNWSLVSGAIPPGLALGVGVVWGIPTTPGTYVFTARVTDNLGATTTGQFSITVS